MKAYYIHWSYPASADDVFYYSGKDDDRLFHHKENAIKCAEDILETYKENTKKAIEIDRKMDECLYTPTPEEHDLLYYLYGDIPNDYTICERDIVFEDEE